MPKARTRSIVAALTCAAILGVDSAHGAEEPGTQQGIDFFETRVRPVLADNCFKCHGPIKQFAELRLDSRQAMLTGGDTGPAIIPGNPDKSLLVEAVRHGDVQMPPNGKLKDHEIAAIEQWVRIGAPWPDTAKARSTADAGKRHWAFQPVKAVSPPDVAAAERIRTPVDRFILAKLTAEKLAPSPPASRRELIRRVTCDLTGLPPSSEDVKAFESDADPAAYEKLVERLLASPQYGEHWGRLWLDVARYSDTKGYVYAREEKGFVHAATYRDWVVKSLNDDVPYNRFVQLQLAADAIAPDDPTQLAAMGYLTLGRRFLGVTPDIVDDRIDVVSRGLLGLTVGCARCHDHKYDPIPTADYYALYGVFNNCTERVVQIGENSTDSAFAEELERRIRTQRDTFAITQGEIADRLRNHITDYLIAQTELGKYHDENFDIVIEKGDLIPLMVRRWESYLSKPERANDPVFAAWTKFAALPADNFAAHSNDVVSWIAGPEGDRLLPEVRQLFATPPASMREVAERYGRFLSEFDRRWTSLPKASLTEASQAFRERLIEAQSSPVFAILYAPESPCTLPAEHICTIERMMDNGNCDLLWKVQGNVDRWIIQSPTAPAFATAVIDKPVLSDQRIFRRGNPSLKGDVVPRRSLELLGGAAFSHGSGRLDLALAVTDAKNPLTGRVWVNRVWAHHFNAGLVRTPSDFGARAEPPSHPELLDWLANHFVTSGWSTKDLHRLIVLSSAYQQQSTPAANSTAKQAQERDPQNRLLWRMNPHRLTFEEMRDHWLTVAGDLDLQMGGRSTDLFSTKPAHHRRTLYGFIDRQFVPTAMRMFDIANPDLHSPQRSETTVPQQALFALNHRIVADCARSLSRRLSDDPRTFVRASFERIYQREPTSAQLDECAEFLRSASTEPEVGPPPGAEDWSYGYGEVDTDAGRVTKFTALPYFSGEAWQGGPNWPDKKLGWVQITATGGHAGNDLKHAAIRRWTAPQAMSVSITSTASHEVAAGDGIKCWIISSRQGILKSQVVHNTQVVFNVDRLDVQPGETLDFVVDFNANLNSDQHLWAPVIQQITPTRTWDAQVHFGARPVAPLTPREQLIQVLLLSNELMFVD